MAASRTRSRPACRSRRARRTRRTRPMTERARRPGPAPEGDRDPRLARPAPRALDAAGPGDPLCPTPSRAGRRSCWAGCGRRASPPTSRSAPGAPRASGTRPSSGARRGARGGRAGGRAAGRGRARRRPAGRPTRSRSTRRRSASCAPRAERGDDFGPLAWRHEVSHPLIARARAARRSLDRRRRLHLPAASTAAEIAIEQRFLELDRATLSVDRLAAELARYAELHRAKEAKGGEPLWRARYPGLPAGPLRPRRRPATALDAPPRHRGVLLASDPALRARPRWRSRSACWRTCGEAGPFAPIFRDVRDPGTPVDWLGRRGERMSATRKRPAARRADRGAPSGVRCSKATAWRCWASWSPKASTRSSPTRPMGSAFSNERWDSARDPRGGGAGRATSG